jgi:hypothetical protein
VSGSHAYGFANRSDLYRLLAMPYSRARLLSAAVFGFIANA